VIQLNIAVVITVVQKIKLAKISVVLMEIIALMEFVVYLIHLIVMVLVVKMDLTVLMGYVVNNNYAMELVVFLPKYAIMG